jgi:hypothetical protein
MRSKVWILLPLVICISGAISASAQKIEYSVASGIDFTRFKTYKWRRADKAAYPTTDVDDMFIRTIEAELAKKGLTRTESDEADLYATYQIAIFEDMEWSSFSSDIQWQGVPPGGGLPGFRGASTSSAEKIRKGSLIIDLYDVKRTKQVWQAYAVKTLADTKDPKKRENNARKVMEKIFKNYPPKAK